MRYYSLIRIVDRRYPGFWNDLGELCRSMREAQITTRGAVVRPLPPVSTAETHTDATGTRSVALMAEVKPPRKDAMQQTALEKEEEARGLERQAELPRVTRREGSSEGRRVNPMLPLLLELRSRPPVRVLPAAASTKFLLRLRAVWRDSADLSPLRAGLCQGRPTPNDQRPQRPKRSPRTTRGGG